MLLIVEIGIILILITALIMFIREENKIKKSKVPGGVLKEYWNGQERRRAKRINASLVVRYNAGKKYHIKRNSLMENVSNSGTCLVINEKFAVGTLLLLEFDLPDTKDIISVKGKVAWADGKFTERDEIGRRIFQTGIQFVNIKPDDKSKLVAYIEKIAEKA